MSPSFTPGARLCCCVSWVWRQSDPHAGSVVLACPCTATRHETTAARRSNSVRDMVIEDDRQFQFTEILIFKPVKILHAILAHPL